MIPSVLLLKVLYYAVLRNRDIYPGSGCFSISDPTKKDEGKNKFVVFPVLVDNFLIFGTGTKKYLSQLTQNLSIFDPKNCY
jgi:hypothetical protein